MNRFVISVLVIGTLTGCAGATPTPAPAATPATTSNPSPTPTLAPTPVPATPAPTPSPAATAGATEMTEGDVEPGRYFADFGGYRYTVTVPDSGWVGQGVGVGGLYQGEDSELAIFWFAGEEPSLYQRACDSSGTEFDPGPSVDDLADAMVSLEDFETTAPTDVTVSGFEGKRVTVTVPLDVDVRSSACDAGKYSLSPNRWYQAPGQTDDTLILDVNGERHLITLSTTPATPIDLAAQLDEMLASLVIEPL
jgi:hypothetical protein